MLPTAYQTIHFEGTVQDMGILLYESSPYPNYPSSLTKTRKCCKLKVFFTQFKDIYSCLIIKKTLLVIIRCPIIFWRILEAIYPI